MNPRHLLTIAWLQWRILVNQTARQGPVSRIGAVVGLVAATLFALSSFVGVVGFGSLVLPGDPPSWLVFAWDGLVVVFLGSSLMGLLVELQQSELLSVGKFLHLPVSPRGVLLLNYVASLLSFQFIMFVPTVIAMGVVVAIKYGGWSWLVPPLVLSFLFMVTALVSAIRSWLGTLMTDPRRRRQLIAYGTSGLVLVSLTPVFLDSLGAGVFKKAREPGREHRRQVQLLDAKLGKREISEDAHRQGVAALDEAREAASQARYDWIAARIRLANRLVPFGWLPQGVESATAGSAGTAILCLLGMGLIGGWGLHGAWKRELRIQSGGFHGRTPVADPAPGSSGGHRGDRFAENRQSLEEGADAGVPVWRPNWVEGRVTGLSPQAAAIAWSTLRGFSRAAEVKLVLLWPLLVLVLMIGGAFSGRSWGLATETRTLAGIGICFLTMMLAMQILGNQFGYDRDGFRCLVLVPVSEREILLGKNVAALPFAAGMGILGLVFIQCFLNLEWLHFVGTVFQLGMMIIVGFLVSNLLSILTPLAVKPGSMQPKNLKMGVVLLQMLLFLLMPLAMIPAILPLGLEWLVSEVPGWRSVPFYVVSSAAGFLVAAGLYRPLLLWQGDLLYRRRTWILETVTQLD